jgi:gas vesicle protein
MTDYQHFGEYRSSERGGFGTGLVLLLIGLGLGAATALLMTPKTGKQLRRNLRRRYEDAMEMMDDWHDHAGEYVNRGSKWAGKARDRGADWADTAREKVRPIGRAWRKVNER